MTRLKSYFARESYKVSLYDLAIKNGIIYSEWSEVYFQYFSLVVFCSFAILFTFRILRFLSVSFISCIFQSFDVFHFLRLETIEMFFICTMTTNIALNVAVVTILFVANINAI